MGLSDEILNPNNKTLIVKDFCTMIDEQVASKSGISGIGIKTAFSGLNKIKPGYISGVVDQILSPCLTALDPIWTEGVQQGKPVQYLKDNSSRTAEALLGVTDEKVKNTKRETVRGIYNNLRSSAKKHVEDAVPKLADIIGKYANK